MMNIEQLLTGGTAVGIVIGLVEVAKQLGINSKFAPLLSLVFSVGIIMGMSGGDISLIIPAIVIGLTASGLYSGAKATIGK